MWKSLFLALLFALGLAWPAVAGDGPRGATPPALSGSWQVSLTYYYDGTPEGFSGNLQYIQHVHKDGRTVIYLPQNQDADAFNETRTACVGEWRHRTGRTFDLTMYCIWQESWADTPSVPDRIRMKVTLAPDGMTWTATPFYYEKFDGTKYVGTGSPDSYGAMNGVRLGIVPIP